MDLSKGRVGRCLLAYSIPLMLTLVLQQAYSIVDTVIIARYCSRNDLAVVSAASTVFSFLYNLITGLSVGVGINAGLKKGERDDQYLKNLAETIFMISLAVGIAIAGITILMARPILIIMKTPAEIMDKSVTVLRLYGVGLFFYSLISFSVSQINAMGNSRETMIIAVFCEALNIVLDCVFILGLGTDVMGAVYASLICQCLQAVFSLALQRRITPEGGRGIFMASVIGDSLPLSASATLQSMSASFALMFIQARINSCGVSYMNGGAVAMLSASLLGNAVNGYAQGYQGFLSVNYGAGLRDRVKEGTKVGYATGFACAAIVCVGLVVLIRPAGILMLGKGDETALDFAAAYAFCYLPYYFFLVISQLTGAGLRVRKITKVFVPAAIVNAAVTVVGAMAVPTVMLVSVSSSLAKAAEAAGLAIYYRIKVSDHGRQT